MKEFWDQRYSEGGYAYGQEPNAYFRNFLDSADVAPGFMLLPGEGEGRNAVFAAQKGWEVDAFDQSEAGRGKALQLAALHQVHIRYTVADILEFPFRDNTYDLIGMFFFHLPKSLRVQAHLKIANALKPGGLLIAELFSQQQLGKASGGPQTPELLYDAVTLKSDFPGLDFLYLEEKNVELDEGPYHQGEASVVRLLAQKPNFGSDGSF